ncbi:hypothetical protein T4D_1824 [Trichinella pseudospiralis]|uniref:Uncharacterized protein n=1 Tax=Trichinella pseudospiralis TaxID=6337 RepID=A0A0V1G5T9_TRIPS|nr:hypothetical protein T4D_1824 [Trichinella pseudospiralis]
MPYKASLSRLAQACAYIAGARGQVTQLPQQARCLSTALAFAGIYKCNEICNCLEQAHIFSTKTGLSNTCILSTKDMPPSETGAWL